MDVGIKLKASIIAFLVLVLSAATVAAVLFLPAILFAGPRSGLLPGFAQKIVLALAWLGVIVIPSYLSIRAYRWQLNRSMNR